MNSVLEGVALDDIFKAFYSAVPAIWDHQTNDENEVVGVVWSNGRTYRFTNQARSKHRFSVGQIAWREALQSVDLNEVVPALIYHSHPGGSLKLSWDDERSMKQQFEHGLPIPWVVVTEDAYIIWGWDVDEGKSLLIREGFVQRG